MSLPAFRWDVKLEALTFTHGSKSTLFFLGREAVVLTSWLDSQKEQGGPFKTGLWMLLREGRQAVSAVCMWVFNEYELIKLATLNYKLIPLKLLSSQPLARDGVLQTFCPNLLGSDAPL